ncbi:hypothetical protein BDZ97DRAFT_1790245 [Flammula alnicola]|nr:hypothetical protein BDZ97DRAFT_1790245 [Flammula alnicola]
MSSTTSFTSTSSLMPSSPHKSSTKNWESAFGELSSSYGFSGGIPSLPQKVSKSTKSKTKVPKSSIPSSQPQSSVTRQPKDYESAFGSLSATYGFGGGIPSLSSKK